MADDIETVDLALVAPVTVEGVARTDAGRAVPIVVDKPPRLGGTDRGPMPSEVFLAALGSCHMMTARKVADKRGVAWSGIRCTAAAHFVGGDIGKVVLHYAIESPATAAAWDTVLRLADRTCTISKITSCPIERVVALQPPRA